MKPICEKTQGLLALAVRGDIDESVHAEALSHARACPVCEQSRKFFERLHEAMSRAPLASPPPSYFEGVLAEIHRRMPVTAPRRATSNRLRFHPQSVASVVMGVLAFCWIGTVFMTAPAWREHFDSSPKSRMAGHQSVAEASISHATNERSASSFVLVRQVGFVDSKSEILKFSPEQCRELGLPEIRIAYLNDPRQRT